MIIADIVGYEGLYQVSEGGIVFRNGKPVRAHADKKGYLYVVFSKNAIRKAFKVHRLVAIAFIENPESKAQVNHKDGNKLNNDKSNLEWNTNRENYDHAVLNGLHDNRFNRLQKNSRKVEIEKGDNVIEFKSIKDAANFIGTSRGALGNVLNGSRRMIKGFRINYI